MIRAHRPTHVPRILLHVVLPVGAGAAVYVLFRSPRLRVFRWLRALGLDPAVAAARAWARPVADRFPEWLLFNAPDGLWVYGLTAALALAWRGRRGRARRAWLCAGVALGAGGELGQRMGLVPGVFDPADLLLCVAAWGAALVLDPCGERSMNRQVLSAMIVGGFALLALGSTDGGSPSPEAPGADSAAAAPAGRNSHFAHGTLNVRAGPGERFRVLRQLRRGDTLSLAEPDARGWARIMGADSGYVFTRLDRVRTEPPAVVPDYPGACGDAMRQVHLRMNRAPDEVKTFREKGVQEVTWWYRERPRDPHPQFQFSFRTGPYENGCGTSRIES